MSPNLEQIETALGSWPLGRPFTLRPTDRGTNNRSWFVEAPSGAYVLRAYPPGADPARLRYEHALLHRLQHVQLSFAVPAPIPARAGETLLRGAALPEQPILALFPVLPGSRPHDADVASTAVCGAALAELDRALARIETGLPPRATVLFGELPRIHRLVPDPLRLAADVPFASSDQARLQAIVQMVLDAVPALYARLPRQLIHGDFGRSNVLMLDDRVSGVLDFEVAGPDLRAMDLAAGVSLFLFNDWGSGEEHVTVRAFGVAYLQRCPLTPAEVAALPILLRLHRVVSLIHRAGMVRQGLAEEEALTQRAVELVELDRWLDTRAEALTAELLAVVDGPE